MFSLKQVSVHTLRVIQASRCEHNVTLKIARSLSNNSSLWTRTTQWQHDRLNVPQLKSTFGNNISYVQLVDVEVTHHDHVSNCGSLQPKLLCSVEQRRFRRKSTKIKKELEDRERRINKMMQSTEDDSDDDDDDTGDESDDDDEYRTTGDDTDEKVGYKDVTVQIGSLRVDNIIGMGLNMPRGSVEDAFYDNKIRVNGTALSKKSKSLEEGDIVDVITDKSDDKTIARRVIIKKVHTSLTANGKYMVDIRRWKTGVEVEDSDKSWLQNT